ncbi:uncharacterized protein [Pocillopora verrucosa]|uniref:uncharacterized protein isoform X3 n=1 Tax=Pocillopora verrucosa TaxID=203993 RepID=UPI003342A7DF
MPTLDDIIEGATNKSKRQLQEALLGLLKGNPDILDLVTKSKTKTLQDKNEITARCANEQDAQLQRSSSLSHPELENQLNRSPRPRYQWQLSDSDGMPIQHIVTTPLPSLAFHQASLTRMSKDDGIDSTWTATTKHMSPRELSKWRKELYSIYTGYLPCDITKKELVQLFGEVGNVQDVHLQPSRGGNYTYGFIRYCTLDECHDAIALLHGRLLGNSTITVEYASETKGRMSCDDPDDVPHGKRDRLLRDDFPRPEQYRSMSEGESQEKMVLWKLRCSARRQKTSSTGNMMDTQECDKEESLINALQEIVKKVSSLPGDTLASPCGSEGTPCSPWIMKEINGGGEHHMSNQQSVATHFTEEGLQSRRIYEHNVTNGTNTECLQSMELTNHQEVFQHTDNQLISGRPCEADALHSRNSTLTFSPLKRYDSVGSPGMRVSQGRYFSPSSSDETSSPGRYTSPISQDFTPSPTIYTSPSCPDVTPSPRRGDTSLSEVETSGSFSFGSLSLEKPLRQDCNNCHEEITSNVLNSIHAGSTPSPCPSCASSLNGMELCSFESDRHYNELGPESPVSFKVPHQDQTGAAVSTINGEVVQDFKGVSPRHDQIKVHDTYVQIGKESDSVPTKTPPVQCLPREHPLKVEKNTYPASLKPLSPNNATVPLSSVPALLPAELVSPAGSSIVGPHVSPPIDPGSGSDPPTGATASCTPEPVSSSNSSTNQKTKLESANIDPLPLFKSTPYCSRNKIDEETSLTQSPGSSNSPPDGSCFDGLAKESREGTEFRRFTHVRQEADDQGRFNAKDVKRVTSSSGTLESLENEMQNSDVKSLSPSKMTQSELRLKDQKNELKRIVRENETMRRNIDWTKSRGMAGNREGESQLKEEISVKELFLQKEKEIFVLRNQEQELLFEREKLEAAFDQQLKKQLETEQKIGKIENKIHLAKLENELLRLYQDLYGYTVIY